MKTAEQVLLVLWTALFLYGFSNGDQFSTLVPDGVISAHLGSSVVLPCELDPTMDCKDYEVRWYRSNNYNNPVLLYKDLKVQENIGETQYRGRVSLTGELQKGNVSLKVENLTLADKGEYLCFVKSLRWYDVATVRLSITVIGSPPVISLSEAGEQVNVTCASGGWSPQPTVIWGLKDGRRQQGKHDSYTTDSDGLLSVNSWMLSPPSELEWISCSVGLSDQEIRESRVLSRALILNYTDSSEPDKVLPSLIHNHNS